MFRRPKFGPSTLSHGLPLLPLWHGQGRALSKGKGEPPFVYPLTRYIERPPPQITPYQLRLPDSPNKAAHPRLSSPPAGHGLGRPPTPVPLGVPPSSSLAL